MLIGGKFEYISLGITCVACKQSTGLASVANITCDRLFVQSPPVAGPYIQYISISTNSIYQYDISYMWTAPCSEPPSGRSSKYPKEEPREATSGTRPPQLVLMTSTYVQVLMWEMKYMDGWISIQIYFTSTYVQVSTWGEMKYICRMNINSKIFQHRGPPPRGRPPSSCNEEPHQQ